VIEQPHPQPSDGDDLDDLLPGIAAGDTRAFAAWVARSEERLRASLRRFAADVDVEAVLQETLLRLWQVAPRVERDGRPSAFLRLGIRIARNAALDELRRGARAARFDPAEAEEPPSVSEPDPLLRRLIADCRERLPRPPRRALDERLRSGGAEPDSALAARVGMQLSTFLQNIVRARRLLADCLERQGVRLAPAGRTEERT
jgi:RNA polymerase sigma-70 factor (ECF subfamily)